MDIILGTQWGDEGKGKVVDYVSANYDMVVRVQGGHNAGHTIHIGNKKHVLHILPSGMVSENTVNIIGNGTVVSVPSFIAEMKLLHDDGINTQGRIFVSSRAHLIMPYHSVLDNMNEFLKGDLKIGTTGKGIGPAYADKIAREGLRVDDLKDITTLKIKLKSKVDAVNTQITSFLKTYNTNKMANPPKIFDYQQILDETLQYRDVLLPVIADTEYMINDAIADGKNVLVEGAQGALLDIDFGTYPFVTSSSCMVGGVFSGSGVSPFHATNVIGITKAYTTRVGEGPYPTEIKDKQLSDHITEIGNEYGATTGRRRRVGWLDLVALKYTYMINGITHIALTKIDVLNDLDTVKVCVEYRLQNGTIVNRLPSHKDELENAEPIYKEFPGWKTDITNAKTFDDFPQELKNYLNFISSELAANYFMLSIGPDRTHSIPISELR